MQTLNLFVNPASTLRQTQESQQQRHIMDFATMQVCLVRFRKVLFSLLERSTARNIGFVGAKLRTSAISIRGLANHHGAKRRVHVKSFWIPIDL